MNKRRRWFGGVLVILLTLAGCGGPEGQLLPFTSLDQGETLRGEKMTKAIDIYVIASPQEIESFARDVLETVPEGDNHLQRFVNQLRQLNYEQVFALLVLRERLGVGGSSITVQQITRQDNRVSIHAKFTDPGPRQARSANVTEPHHLIAISKIGTWGGPIQFELVGGSAVIAETTHLIP